MVTGWIGLLLIFQLWLSLPPSASAAEPLRGASHLSDNAADAAEVDEVAYMEESEEKHHQHTRRTSSRFAATNDTAIAAIDQFHREMRLPHQTRIVGGQAANPYAFSFMVSLQDSNGFHYCGGTLVSKDCVLTAAHCTNRVTGNGPITVVIGRSKLSDESKGERLQVSREIIHPMYDPSKSGYKHDGDFALLFLRRPTMTKAKIIKVNPNRYYPTSGSVVQALGWGDKTQTRRSQTHLMNSKLQHCMQCRINNAMPSRVHMVNGLWIIKDSSKLT